MDWVGTGVSVILLGNSISGGIRRTLHSAEEQHTQHVATATATQLNPCSLLILHLGLWT